MHTPFSFLCGEEVGEGDILQFEAKALMEKHKNKLKRINELGDGDEVGWEWGRVGRTGGLYAQQPEYIHIVTKSVDVALSHIFKVKIFISL